MDANGNRYWFAAKRYGWGWSYPVTWQGWLVVGVYVALLAGGLTFLRGSPSAWPLPVFVGAITVALIVVVAAKGERPLKWRWGRK